MHSHDSATRDEDNGKAAQVYCLALDLVGSTEAGLGLTTQELDRFNIALVNQIWPHLERVGLENMLVKFTGDGWLVISDQVGQVPSLCCLATIMVQLFQKEINAATGLRLDHIPALRVAVCSGRDVKVSFPDGRIDYVGDSIRRAVRACDECAPNEVLIGDSVREQVFRDFGVEERQWQGDSAQAKREESFPIYALGDLKTEAAAQSDAPEYFVNTFTIIGKSAEASRLAREVSGRLEKVAVTAAEEEGRLRRYNRLLASMVDYATALEILDRMKRAGPEPDVVTYNTVASKAEDYQQARGVVEEMQTAGIEPNVVTYNTLVSKAEDYQQARAVVEEMQTAGIEPNVVTYNTLIDRAPDYETGKAWLKTMQEQGIMPGVVTYTTLIDRAPDYETAKALVLEMQECGIGPTVETYSAVFSKDLSATTPAALLAWYLGEAYHPDAAVEAAIAFYRKKGAVDHALKLALHYPHTGATRKLIRQHGDKAVSYFEAMCARDPQNGHYALGIALMELQRYVDAKAHLEQALALAEAEPRRADIERRLRQIDGRLG